LPNSLVLNLRKSVRFEPSGDGKSGVLIFPSDGSENQGKKITDKTNKYGYILDGQHRLVGFDYAPTVVFDLPVTAFVDADDSLGKKVFTDINSTQTKVSPILMQAIQYEIGELQPEKQAAVTVAKRLNEQTDSPFYGMVKFSPDERGKISSVTLSTYIRPIIGLDGPLYEKNENQRVQILRNYFQAYKDIYPQAWGSKIHVLTKTLGLHVMTGLFARVYKRCERYEGGNTTVDAFKNQLQNLVSVKELDWNSDRFGSMTNRKGMEALRRAILRVLPVEKTTAVDPSPLKQLSLGQSIENISEEDA
jgi:DGQHR domain-containing protein